MCGCVCMCVRVLACTCVHMRVRVSADVCMFGCTGMLRTWRVCMCVHVYLCMCACAYGCVHDCVYLQACVRGVCVSEPKIVSLFTLSSLAHSYACRAKYLQNTQYWNSPLQLAPVAPVHVTQPRHLAVHHQLSLSQIHTILLKLY